VIDDGTLVTVLDQRDGIVWSSPLYRAGGLLFQVWSGKFMSSLAAPEVLPALIGPDGKILDYFLGYTGEESEARLRAAVETVLASI
jgi:hypothetical protein